MGTGDEFEQLFDYHVVSPLLGDDPPNRLPLSFELQLVELTRIEIDGRYSRARASL